MEKPFTISMLTDRAGYADHFMDLNLWEPHLRNACAWHGFSPAAIKPGIPGTFPTFIVELNDAEATESQRAVVIKFLGPLFEGIESFNIERDLGHWLQGHALPIASPGILAHGQLDQDWKYLIFEHIAGVSIGQVREALSQSDWFSIARHMGEYIKQLHSLTSQYPSKLPGSIQPSTEKFSRFIQQQLVTCRENHQTWNDLPAHWIAQIEDFVLPLDQLIDFTAPAHLIHADLTSDHLLGRMGVGGWHTLAVIDWGDAMTGNLLYELVSLQVDLFRTDKVLLQACLDAYGLPGFYRQDFPRKALSMVLLHQFPMPAKFYAPYLQLKSLQELAECLFAL
jgi:hypothetical protein